MNTENNSGFKWESRLTSLRKWRLNSFKSVAHQVEVDLAPLTVVVGANSSGKSTLIQSILLMAQNAMRSDERSTPKSRGIFELNGPLVQLGTFRETACDLARTNNSYLEFGGLWFASDRIVRSNEFNDSASSGFTRVGEQSLVWDLKLRPIGKELDSGLGIVESSLVESYRKGSLEEKSEVSFRSSKQDIELLRSKYERFSFEHNAKKDDHRKGRSSKDNVTKSRLDAVTFQAGLPTSGLVKKNVVEYMFECQEELFSEAIVMGYSKDPDSENSQDVAKQYDSIESVIEDYVIQLADFGKRIVQQDRSSEDRGVASLSRIIEQNLLIPIEQFPEDSLKYFGTEVSTFEETLQKTANTLFQVRFMEGLRSRFDELFGDAEWTQEETYCLPSGRRSANPELDSPGSSSTLPRLIKYWNRYLSENVLYLGPLRVGPRATYGIGSTIENYNLPLGESGEFLAKKMFTAARQNCCTHRKKTGPDSSTAAHPGRLAVWRAACSGAPVSMSERSRAFTAGWSPGPLRAHRKNQPAHKKPGSAYQTNMARQPVARVIQAVRGAVRMLPADIAAANPPAENACCARGNQRASMPMPAGTMPAWATPMNTRAPTIR